MGNAVGQHASTGAETGIDVEVEELLPTVATPYAVNFSVGNNLATAD